MTRKAANDTTVAKTRKKEDGRKRGSADSKTATVVRPRVTRVRKAGGRKPSSSAGDAHNTARRRGRPPKSQASKAVGTVTTEPEVKTFNVAVKNAPTPISGKYILYGKNRPVVSEKEHDGIRMWSFIMGIFVGFAFAVVVGAAR